MSVGQELRLKWGLLSLSATLQADARSAGSATAASMERDGAVAGRSTCGKGRGCARPCAGETPALPGGRHPDVIALAPQGRSDHQHREQTPTPWSSLVENSFSLTHPSYLSTPPLPTRGNPLSIFLDALVALRHPSWPFVDNSFKPRHGSALLLSWITLSSLLAASFERL